jgi:hypothetical protein
LTAEDQFRVPANTNAVIAFGFFVLGRENKGATAGVPQANAGRGRGHLEMNYSTLF